MFRYTVQLFNLPSSLALSGHIILSTYLSFCSCLLMFVSHTLSLVVIIDQIAILDSSALQEGKNEWFMHLPKVKYLCIYRKAKFIWIDLLKGGSLYLQLRQQADQQAGGELRQPSSRFGRCITGRCLKYYIIFTMVWDLIPFEPTWPSVGWSVCRSVFRIFQKGVKIHFQAPIVTIVFFL